MSFLWNPTFVEKGIQYNKHLDNKSWEEYDVKNSVKNKLLIQNSHEGEKKTVKCDKS